MKSKLILLTGASGFIGTAFLNHAMEKGFRVRVLTRKPKHFPSQDRLEIIEGDFSSQLDWGLIVKNVDFVVNAAAEIKDPDLMPFVNVLGPERLLRASIIGGVRRWVQLSSVGSYGPILSGLVSEGQPDNPFGPYEVSKSDFDFLLKKKSLEHGIEFCIVRPSNVYGPGMSNQSIQEVLNAIRKNLFAFIGPEGASANYVHVQDVVQALHLCVSHPKAANQTFIVSAWATIEEMTSGLAAGAELKAPKRRIPVGVATLLAIIMQWWPRWPLTLSRVQAMSVRNRYSTKKIEKELGWELTVPLKKGMRDFARDLR